MTPSGPDINLFDYFVWGAVEQDTNRIPHTTIVSLKANIKEVMTFMNRTMMKRVCGSFRKRLSFLSIEVFIKQKQ